MAHGIVRASLLVVAALTASSGVPAVADDDLAVFDLSMEQLLDIHVVSASRGSQQLSKAPATVMVITQRQIRERGYKDLKDVFRDLPGFDISENNAGEVRTLVISRGMLRNNKIMVLRDGKKLNSPGGELFVYGNNIPLHDVDRIEIIYGPSSAMYGADAFSGVVNLITRKVEETDRPHRAEVALSYGTEETLDLSSSVAMKLHENISFVGNARVFRAAGVAVLSDFSADEIFRIPASNAKPTGEVNDWQQPVDDYVLSSKIRFGNVTLGLYRQNAREPNGPATDVTQTGATYVYDDSYVWHQKMNIISLDHTTSGDRYTLDSYLSYTDYALGRDSGWIYSWGPQYKYATTMSMKIEEVLNLRTSDRSRVVGGVMFETVRCFPKTNNLSTRFSGDQLLDYVDYPDDPGLPAEYRGQRVYFGVFDYQNTGIFGEVTVDLLDNLQVNLGARYDYHTDYDDVINPRTGIVWGMDGRTNVKLLYGTSYIAPSKYVAYEHWSAGDAFGFYPNPDLKPERLQSVSLNVQRVFGRNIVLSLNGFHNKLTDLIGTEGYPWMRNVNCGEATTRGFELLLDYRTEWLSTYLHYSFLDATLEDGTNVPKVADHKIGAGVTARRGLWSVSPRVRWSDDIAKIPNPAFDDSRSIEGHLVADLTLRRESLAPGLDVYSTVTNLFDTKYFGASPYGEGLDGWLMDKAPQPGRSFALGVSRSF